MKNLGTIKLGSKVMISDPCYGTIVWCNRVVNVKEGTYNCFVDIDKCNSNSLVTSLRVVHSDYPKKRCTELIAYAGVDSGTCGIYDNEYYEKWHGEQEVDEKWYQDNVVSWVLKDVAHICDGFGVISSTYYGDGSYRVYAAKNNEGEIVGLKIDYNI